MKLKRKKTTVKGLIKRFFVALLKMNHRQVVNKLETGVTTVRTVYKNKEII